MTRSDRADVDEAGKARMRAAVAEAVGTGAARLRTASAPALIGILAVSALAPLALAPAGAMVAAGLAVLGSVGANVLTDVVTAAVAKLRPDEIGAPQAAAAVRQAFLDRVEAAFASSSATDQRVRDEVIALFATYDIAGTALEAAAGLDDAELLPRMVGAFADLTATVTGFGSVLVNTRLDVHALHEELRREIARQSADRERSRQTGADLRRLLDAVRALRMPQPWTTDVPARWDGSPFLGLMPFEERHSAVFYGRHRLTQELTNRLAERLSTGEILLVIGASGAGKSSLLRAGVLAAVADDRLVPGSSRWPRWALNPSVSPVQHLAANLANLGAGDAASVYEALLIHPERAHLLAAQIVASASPNPDPPRLVLVVDQLEELFTLGIEPAEQQTFLIALHAMATTPTGPAGLPAALVVAGIRGDFLDQATAVPALERAAQNGVFTVGPMTEAELTQAITGPAAEAGVAVPAELTAAILHDLRDRTPAVGFDSGALPLLSQVMFVMWQADDAERLTVAGYHRTGGIAGIVQTSAESAYLGLTESHRDLVRRVLVHLTRVTDGRLTRNLSTYGALRIATGCTDSHLDAVLDAFTEERLITRGEGDSVSIAHEELLRSWTRLHGWLQPGIADQALHRALIDDVQGWRAHGNDASYLYRGGQLHAVQESVNRWTADPARSLIVDADVREFLAASTRRNRRRRRVYQSIASVMAVLIVATTGAAVLANRNATLAAHNAQRVEQQHAVALSRQLAAQSQAVSPTQWGLGQRLAAAALHTSLTREAADAASARLAHYGDILQYPDQAMTMAFSPDGKTLAVAGNAQIWLWHLAGGLTTGAPLATNPTGTVNAIAFSPDGTTLASGTDDGVVQLVSVVTGRQIGAALVEKAHPLPDCGGCTTSSQVQSVAFSPDGNTLMITSHSSVRIWHLGAARSVRRLPGPGAQAGALSEDGTRLAVSRGPMIELWNSATGRRVTSIRGSWGVTEAVAFSPDGKLLATGGANDRTVRVWNLATGRQTAAPMTGHTRAVESVAFSRDGKLLASGGDDNAVRLWNPATGKQIGAPLTGHTYVVSTVMFSPDGRSLASASWDGTVRLWNPSTGLALDGPVVAEGGSNAVAYSPDGKLLAYGADDDRAYLWNLANGSGIGGGLDMQSNRADAMAFSPDGRLLATTGAEGVLTWNPRTGVPVGKPMVLPLNKALEDEHSANEVNAISFNPDGTMLASGSDDGLVRLWNVATRQQIGRPLAGHSGKVSALAFRRNGTILASAGQDKTIRLWDPVTHRQIGRPLPGGAEINAVAFNQDGSLLASGGNDDAVRLWNPATGRAVGPVLTGHTDPVTAVAFSPDGTMLASASEDETARLWNPATGEQLGVPLTGHSSTVGSVAFSPDGSTLATSSYDETVRQWHLASFTDPIRRLCHQAGELTAEEWTTYASDERFSKACG